MVEKVLITLVIVWINDEERSYYRDKFNDLINKNNN